MIEVEELLSDEEFVFFEEAVAQAKTFLEAQERFSSLLFVNGREIGASAPEKTHQVAPVPPVRTVEHTWYIVLQGYAPNFFNYSLLEVVYHLQGEEWCYTIKLLEQRTPHPSPTEKEV